MNKFRVHYLVLLMLCCILLLGSCKKSPAGIENETVEEYDQSIISEDDGTEDEINIHSSIKNDKLSISDGIIHINPLINICDAELITDHKLSYKWTSPAGDILNESAIRLPVLYSGNNYYYTDIDGDNLVVSAYDFCKNEVLSSCRYPFDYADDSYVECDGDLYFAPCVVDSDSGKLVMSLLKYNPLSGMLHVICNLEAASLRADVKKLSNDKLVLFMYKLNDGSLIDSIYLYMPKSNVMTLIYEDANDDWTNEKLTTRNIRTIDTSNGLIYILKDQIVEGNVRNYLSIIDENGELINEKYIEALDYYGDQGYRVCSIICFGECIYVELISPTGGELYILLYAVDGVYHVVDTGNCKPKQAISLVLETGKLIVRTSESNTDLLIIDSINKCITPVVFEIEGEDKSYDKIICSNEKGEIVIILRNNNSPWAVYKSKI